jgi:pilus assembly protein CpaB
MSLVAALGAVAWTISWIERVEPDPQVANQQSAWEPLKILMTSEAVDFGEKLTAKKLQLVEWHANTLPEGAISSIEELNLSVDEHYFLPKIRKGAPVFRDQITAPGQKPGLSAMISGGMVAVTVPVNTITGVAGFVLPDERVDVLLVRREGSGRVADVVLENVRVLAVDSAFSAVDGNPRPAKSVTFELSRENAQRLILANGLGDISLALRSLSAGGYTPVYPVSDRQVATFSPSFALGGDAEYPSDPIDLQMQIDRKISVTRGLESSLVSVTE